MCCVCMHNKYIFRVVYVCMYEVYTPASPMPGVIRPSGVRDSSMAPTYTATVGCISKSLVTPDREPIAANYIHECIYECMYAFHRLISLPQWSSWHPIASATTPQLLTCSKWRWTGPAHTPRHRPDVSAACCSTEWAATNLSLCTFLLRAKKGKLLSVINISAKQYDLT